MEAFLSRFSKAVAAATDQYPVATVWCSSHLITLISQIKARLKADGFNVRSLPSNQALIAALEHIGLAKLLLVAPPRDNCQAVPAYYQIEIGAGARESSVDVTEVLQASMPDGVLCYASALRYYGLTTQRLSFQHIAKIVPIADEPNHAPHARPHSSPSQMPRDASAVASAARTPRGRRETLGTPSFIYQGVACYSLRRQAHTIPGIQQRILSPRARIRITTFEQTLLDTLYKPLYCGGPAIVFEAWQQHPERLNQAALTSLVETIENDHWARRAGYMMEGLALPPHPAWNALMDAVLHRLDRADERNWLSLLPGVEYSTHDDKWMLKVP